MASIARKMLASSRGLISAVAVILALSLFGSADIGANEASKESSSGDAALFDRVDANRDGSISADEVTAENRTLFDRLIRRGDTNRDRALSRQEFLDALVPT